MSDSEVSSGRVKGTIDSRTSKQRENIHHNMSYFDGWNPDINAPYITQPMSKLSELEDEIKKFNKKASSLSTAENASRQKEYSREVSNRLYRMLRDHLALPEDIKKKYSTQEQLDSLKEVLDAIGESYDYFISPYPPKS